MAGCCRSHGGPGGHEAGGGGEEEEEAEDEAAVTPATAALFSSESPSVRRLTSAIHRDSFTRYKQRASQSSTYSQHLRCRGFSSRVI